MKHKPGLKRLLARQTLATLWPKYAALLQDRSICLVDAQGRCLMGDPPLDQSALARLWESVCDQGKFIDPSNQVTAWPIKVEATPLGMLLVTGALPDHLTAVATLLVLTLETLAAEAVARRAIAQETLDRYREINVLYKVGETLGACVELDEVCRLVLDESIKLINSRYGAVLLFDPALDRATLTPDVLEISAATGLNGLSDMLLQHALPVALHVIQSGKPQIVNDFQPENFAPTSLVCAPLRFQEEVLGAVLLIEKAAGGDFAAADEKLLFALSTQAASSIENARLFEDVKRQRDEIATMKNYMDNIFASIASGVITTDVNDIITTFNQAAETILDLPSLTVLQRPYQQALAFLNNTPLPHLIQAVQKKDRTFIDQEINPVLPERGQVYLSLSLARLRGSAQEPLGVTIVLDDVTEKKKFEREKRMVRRYLPPELLDSLPDNLDELKLKGERQTVTTLFADIRGFTSFSESHSPEEVVQVINEYFALAAKAVREHQGIVDKYLGDAVMAVFNTPLLKIHNHAWQAVQAAWEIQQNVKRYHVGMNPDKRMNFGIGICTGEAVVGNVGTIDRMEYTAIGDAVNVAKRLQENAAAGQIIISRSTWERTSKRITAEALDPVTLKGRRSPTDIYRLLTLKRAREN